MNQMPISECYLSKFNIQPHYHRLHTQSQIGISTLKGISNSGAYFTCNTCNNNYYWYTRFIHIKVQVYYYSAKYLQSRKGLFYHSIYTESNHTVPEGVNKQGIDDIS